MKIALMSLALGAACFAFSGCTAVTYTKSVSVKKDATGKVVETVDFESITEPHSESGKINFDDLMGEKRYDPWVAYAQSKLANLLFAYELQRKLFQKYLMQ